LIYELVLQDKHSNTIYTSTIVHISCMILPGTLQIEGSSGTNSKKESGDSLKESLRQKEILMIELQTQGKEQPRIISSLLSLGCRNSDENARAVS
jgi:hypothetical protein